MFAIKIENKSYKLECLEKLEMLDEKCSFAEPLFAIK